ncbi:hypothetical protein BDN67DRAFT_869342, partial [Paxillus ammoniavirescens]
QSDDISVPTWKWGIHEVWFRSSEVLLDHQLLNPDFKNNIDYAPHPVYRDQGQCIWSDFMIGNQAW